MEPTINAEEARDTQEQTARPVWQVPAVVDLATTRTASGIGSPCLPGSSASAVCTTGAGFVPL